MQLTFASCPTPTSPFPPQVLTVSDAATGATVWSAVGGAGAPIVGGDVVYVQGPDDEIKAYDAGGCGLAVSPALASLAVPPDEAAMAVGEGHLVVVSADGTAGRYRLTAFAPPAPA